MEEAIADMVLAELGIENLRPSTKAELLGVKDIDSTEAKFLFERCMPHFAAAGLPCMNEVLTEDITCTAVAALWGGMGAVYEITAKVSGLPDISIIAKHVDLTAGGTGGGDGRRRASYLCELAFYSKGHAAKLRKSGCIVPIPLYADVSPEQHLWICMTKLRGETVCMGLPETLEVMKSLARLHAIYWGCHSDHAAASGLQAQGCYWNLDAQKEQHAKMPKEGWESRLRLAASAIDQRLKSDRMQTVCHGDAKSENIMFAYDGGKPCALFYDFQYCGKAVPTKDLAYVLTCATNTPQEEEQLLHTYHTELSDLLQAQGVAPPTKDELLESLDLSFCDLGRWMSGWGWWGNPLEHRIRSVLDKLDDGLALNSEEEYHNAVLQHYPVR